MNNEEILEKLNHKDGLIKTVEIHKAMEAARKDEAEKSADGHLLKIMKEEPVKVIMWVLAKLGMEMEEAHVGEMDLSQEVTVNSVRYRIAAKVTIKSESHVDLSGAEFVQPGEKKPFIVANVREILDYWNNGEGCTFSRMVEMFNEVADKFYDKN